MREPRPASADITHSTLSVLFIALLIASTFWVLKPFLVAILWATIVAVAAWPLFMKLEAFVGGRRKLAVAIMTAVILLVVFVPVTLSVATIVRNGERITSVIRSFVTMSVPDSPDWIEHVPLAGARIAGKWNRFAALGPDERSAALAPYVQTALQWFVAKAGSIGTMLLQFLLTTIITAILFAHGETVREGILRFARRLAGQPGYDVAILAGQAVRSVVLGVVVTALIQTAIGGAGLLLSGVPATSLLTAAMFFFCLSQLGPMPVLLPATAWLYWSGKTGWGTTLLLIAIVAAAIDGFVRPLLIKRGADLPLLLIFAGVIGGLIAFGIIGLFIGPVILAVTYTLLKAWVASGLTEPAGEASETVARVI
jgi:predicted PurR-regulated permease PerM